MLAREGKELTVRIIEPADARFEIVSAEAPAPQAKQVGVVNLTIRQPQKVKSLRLVVLLSPKSDPALNIKVRPLANWIDAAPIGK